MRALRHDFRHWYGCAYPTEDTGETLDLIAALPDGSMYVRETDRARAWCQSQHDTADLIDTLWEIAWVRAGRKAEEAPTLMRPAQIVAAERERERRKAKAKSVREILEGSERTEV